MREAIGCNVFKGMGYNFWSSTEMYQGQAWFLCYEFDTPYLSGYDNVLNDVSLLPIRDIK